ncbi:carbamoyltransferase HypF [Treponema sp.]|uniref:carbamoyltransferase HypF n=1 Tax=Treponema sp. TaxID=166 RepID=UPI00298DD34F|nr:carbamoyltransferase HypF [Treponema sp.]
MKECHLIRVYGIVQGVGFRPFVARTASACKIAGSVCNKGPYVEIYAEQTKENIDLFLKKLKDEAPERSAILKIQDTEIELINFSDFKIIESQKVKGDIFVSPDIALCEKCKKELLDKNDRRYLHPFINCTACGPRLTILDSMPYDRVRTSMKNFPMCPECDYEYTHEETRRYHAQPVCCNKCGPKLYIIEKNAEVSIKGNDTITYCRKLINEGKIIAIKGIGGFHLCCDATNEEAVSRLRKLKHRPQKPFAVMAKDISCVKKQCELLETQHAILNGPQKPILLLKKKEDTILAPSVAPDNPNVGIMIPYAPVQVLIFNYPDEYKISDYLIMTSANPSGAPICCNDKEVIKYILPICDAVLSNNREIRMRCDDSVMSWHENKPYMIRRSRGYSPIPFMLSSDDSQNLTKEKSSVENKAKSILAIGGELKNTFCISKNDLFYPSPYIGDLADVRSVETLKNEIELFSSLLEVKPDAIVCDMHPKYNSTLVAEELSSKFNIPLYKVQHHFAHVVSCMAENNFTDKVIGVSFDGTGYGNDGSIWGGEFLLCDTKDFTRLGSVEPFFQAGGDLSSKEGWRIAAAILSDASDKYSALDFCSKEEFSVIKKLVSMKMNGIVSTSAGRLFDAAAAVLGIRKASTYEGESSCCLEFNAESLLDNDGQLSEKNSELIEKLYDEFKLLSGSSFIQLKENFFTLKTDLLMHFIADKKLEGFDSSVLAFLFHKIFAEMIFEGCVYSAEKTEVKTIALTGGVMQNILLLNLLEKELRKKDFNILIHSMIPANDGGICLGQAVIGRSLCV